MVKVVVVTVEVEVVAAVTVVRARSPWNPACLR